MQRRARRQVPPPEDENDGTETLHQRQAVRRQGATPNIRIIWLIVAFSCSMNLHNEDDYNIRGWHHVHAEGDCCWRLHWRRALGKGRDQVVARGFAGAPEIEFRSFQKTRCPSL